MILWYTLFNVCFLVFCMSSSLQSSIETPVIRRRFGFSLATFAVLVVMVAIGLFVWRVAHYAQLIRSGEMAEWQNSYAKEMTVSRLAAAASSSGSSSAVATGDHPFLGSKNAPLTIVEFADFTCPYSRQVSFLLRSLAYEYGDRIQYIYRVFPLTDVRPESQLVAEAAMCAYHQGKFWEYHDKLYQTTDDFSRDRLVQYAKSLGLEMGKFIACLDQGLAASEVSADYETGVAAGVYGTPTFFLNGQKIEGAIPADVLRTLVERLTSPS
ncbi:MAG: DSBA oxidoreductase [Candidatus Uhrbacteria bacterium GW2011_GWF2_41_16]|uniref:DSBA oxidoreductase n=2 Tax=Candidatus Uhriibacteriota TaxID=1752732 RepID=A0A0G0YEC6_9BACT|nr:MAG: DSBA oxidoreductase [Candidatus Uhrbacteria bacterium GW2011_GWC2_41_11]KKR98657.1 MAG: DSBA oxidoreductase [Candidatus Uhrbacteria bacterium GW2011_GWF2_41_16]